MRNTVIFAGTSCPALTTQICEHLGMAPGVTELSQFSNVSYTLSIAPSRHFPLLPFVRRGHLWGYLTEQGHCNLQGETSVRIMTSVREKDVFVIQSGSPRINDTIMELLIMISACKGGSATKITGEQPPGGPRPPTYSVASLTGVSRTTSCRAVLPL